VCNHVAAMAILGNIHGPMAFILSLLLFSFQESAKGPVILAIGDSITAGYGVAPELSYPAQLQKELNKRGYAYRVVNLGLTGSTTIQALGRLNRGLALSPDIVIIQLGGNDVSQGIPHNVSRETIRTMIERLKPGGARIFFAGGRFPYLDDLAREQGAEIIPFLTGVEGHADLLLSDGHHPTGDGYAIVVDNILKVIAPSLQTLLK
jgi:acyl-CoA thioesterase-1